MWRGSVVVRPLDLQPRGRRFDSRPRRFTFNLGQVVHTRASVHHAVNWYRCKLGTGNRHSTRHTSPVSVDLQLRLVSGWGQLKRRSAPPIGPLWLGKDFSYFSYSYAQLVGDMCNGMGWYLCGVTCDSAAPRLDQWAWITLVRHMTICHNEHYLCISSGEIQYAAVKKHTQKNPQHQSNSNSLFNNTRASVTAIEKCEITTEKQSK